jgi:RNA polymerase sigma-70 factor (ECF subfamily)
LTAKELNKYIMGCARNERESQKKIYNSFYSYGMSICLRYTNRHDDALEIYNDSFLKIFKEIYHYKPLYADEVGSFKGWIRKIMIYTAIDHSRKNNKHSFTTDFETSVIYLKDNEEDALDRISYEEIITAIRQLSPAYRTVLNLYIVDGFTHEEIAKQLNISVGTSKSNLFKARQQLQQILKNENKIQITKNVG